MLSEQPKGQLQNQLQQSEKHAVRKGKTDNKTNDAFHESFIKKMMGDNNQKEILT